MCMVYIIYMSVSPSTVHWGLRPTRAEANVKHHSNRSSEHYTKAVYLFK
jgi:hypothetical protein